MPFFFWPGLWEVCAVLFGSGAALQYKQLTSSSWPLWTEPAASHEHTGACRAQCLLSLAGPPWPGSSWPSRHRKRISKPPWPKNSQKLPTFFMTPQLFSISWDMKIFWKILFCFFIFFFFVFSGIFFKNDAAGWNVIVQGRLVCACLFRRAAVEAPFSLFLHASIKPWLYTRAACGCVWITFNS